MGQHKVAKAIKEKYVIKFQKSDSPKSQKLTLIINGLRSLPRPYGMVLIILLSLILLLWIRNTQRKQILLKELHFPKPNRRRCIDLSPKYLHQQ